MDDGSDLHTIFEKKLVDAILQSSGSCIWHISSWAGNIFSDLGRDDVPGSVDAMERFVEVYEQNIIELPTFPNYI